MKPQDKYVALLSLLDDYWDKPLSALPKVVQARGGNFTTLWDMLNREQRHELVSQTDYQEDPKNAGQRRIDRHDASLDARAWWDLLDVSPKEAAMLLCRLNPHEKYDCENIERIYVDDDKTSPHRYKLLLRRFEDVASTIPKHRTLVEWRTIAQQHNLRYHSWIDDYADAMGALTGKQSVPDTAKKEELIPVQRQQDNAILKCLRDNKHDPLKLQRGEKGKPDVKKDCRVNVSFSSPSVFNTAWDRLRANGEIKDAK